MAAEMPQSPAQQDEKVAEVQMPSETLPLETRQVVEREGCISP
ncbi:MAG: hypothetical protein N3B10_07965 [Armatimonadetes bacterium]|nr:hypothetical protein [Armatimonadota bacterium]